jgi:cobalt transporter subunit CbtB
MQANTTLDATGSRALALIRSWPALGVIIFGALLLYGVGFSNISVVHSAAHDARHANGFPCH